MKLGVEIFLERYIEAFKGQRVGLVTNHTSVDQNLTPTIDLLWNHPDVHLTALYGPEHGVRGDATAGAEISGAYDTKTGLPIYSLYGDTRKPTPEMLEPVDAIVFDLQDIGARYYTYIYTLSYVMEACMENDKTVIVFDRPNPIGGVSVEGNLIEQGYTSFIGRYPIPNRHGLTVGELALLFKHEFHLDCALTVVPMEGWERKMYFDDTGLFWVPPSPNATGMDMMLLYPGTCLFEGSNLSAGRGTTKPFEYIGAPYIDGEQLAAAINARIMPQVLARANTFTPFTSKYAEQSCEGVQLHIADRSFHAVKVGLIVLETIAQMYPNDFEFRPADEEGIPPHFDLSVGTNRVRGLIREGNIQTLFAKYEHEENAFIQKMTPYLLYS